MHTLLYVCQRLHPNSRMTCWDGTEYSPLDSLLIRPPRSPSTLYHTCIVSSCILSCACSFPIFPLSRCPVVPLSRYAPPTLRQVHEPAAIAGGKPNYWFPAGRVDEGETFVAAGVRETEEEAEPEEVDEELCKI